jgi:uncharacterized membrane protein affecting hemolysin expression
MPQTSKALSKKSARWFRWVQLGLAIVGILALLQWWHYSDERGEQLFAAQSEVLMRETLKALAQTAAYLIENDQLEGLTQLTKQMASNPYIHDVVVYDVNGVRLSETAASHYAQLLYAPSQSPELFPMVQEIYRDTQLLGYIKISLKQDTGFSAVSTAWDSLMEQVLWMLGLSGVLALLLRESLQLLSHFLASSKALHSHQEGLEHSHHAQTITTAEDINLTSSTTTQERAAESSLR